MNALKYPAYIAKKEVQIFKSITILVFSTVFIKRDCFYLLVLLITTNEGKIISFDSDSNEL